MKTINCLSLLFAPLVLTVSVAHAATTYNRTWVAHTGKDSNNCSLIAPCATFQGALSKTKPGGEVDAVDSADYGAVAITFPVTIDGGAAGARIGSVKPQAACSNVYAAICVAVPISAGPVILRNLSLNLVGGRQPMESISRPTRFLKTSKLQAYPAVSLQRIRVSWMSVTSR